MPMFCTCEKYFMKLAVLRKTVKSVLTKVFDEKLYYYIHTMKVNVQ